MDTTLWHLGTTFRYSLGTALRYSLVLPLGTLGTAIRCALGTVLHTGSIQVLHSVLSGYYTDQVLFGHNT